MITYPTLSNELRLKRLEHPAGKPISIVIDTDTFNEIDDQFAVAYALLSQEQIKVEALYAAPFFNELSTGPADGMEKSYQELLKIRKILKREAIAVYRGSTSYMAEAEQYVESDAARNLVERALACDSDNPLYVVGIGAITNVASAIVMEPSIIEKIVVVWLGGNALHWPDTKEFNLVQDVHAARVLFDSGVPLVLAPCLGVATHLTTSLSELREHIYGKTEIGSYLFETYEGCTDNHYAYTRVIWDIAAIAWLVNPEWCASTLVHSPVLSDDCRWSVDQHRHFIRSMYFIQRDKVFNDLFTKVNASEAVS